MSGEELTADKVFIEMTLVALDLSLRLWRAETEEATAEFKSGYLTATIDMLRGMRDRMAMAEQRGAACR